MAEASAEISGRRKHNSLEPGTHAAYFFDSHSEKQSKLFPLCKEIVDAKNASLIYIAGKQGVKGIRLSLKDTGFDVAAYEKRQQMKIYDSEEFFLSSGRQQQFHTSQELVFRIEELAKEASKLGFAGLLILSETDMLVRKGYLTNYKEFDQAVGTGLENSTVTLVCAFDRRELSARG